jgi:hypothetical protein
MTDTGSMSGDCVFSNAIPRSSSSLLNSWFRVVLMVAASLLAVAAAAVWHSGIP